MAENHISPEIVPDSAFPPIAIAGTSGNSGYPHQFATSSSSFDLGLLLDKKPESAAGKCVSRLPSTVSEAVAVLREGRSTSVRSLPACHEGNAKHSVILRLHGSFTLS